MACRNQARLGLGGARGTRQRAHRGSQSDKIEPLAFESFSGADKPRPRMLGLAALQGNLDQSRVAAMDTAQEMHRVREIAAGMTATGFQQRIEVLMART